MTLNLNRSFGLRYSLIVKNIILSAKPPTLNRKVQSERIRGRGISCWQNSSECQTVPWQLQTFPWQLQTVPWQPQTFPWQPQTFPYIFLSNLLILKWNTMERTRKSSNDLLREICKERSCNNQQIVLYSVVVRDKARRKNSKIPKIAYSRISHIVSKHFIYSVSICFCSVDFWSINTNVSRMTS